MKLNARTVWEHLVANHGRYDQLLMVVPDEVQDWVRDVADEFIETYETVAGRAHWAYHDLVADLDERFCCRCCDWTRKDFALRVGDRPDRALLFMLLDGRDISGAIWRSMRPAGTLVAPGAF